MCKTISDSELLDVDVGLLASTLFVTITVGQLDVDVRLLASTLFVTITVGQLAVSQIC